MATYFIPLDHFRRKFYQRENSSKRFLELSEDELASLSKKVYLKEKIMEESISYTTRRLTSLEKYQSTLQYLTNPNIHLELRTFDERMAFLIMMTDPNLITFKEFLKMDLISLNEIDEIEDIKERSHLRQIRSQTVSQYESAIREQLGFFDVKMLKYEEMYFKRFFGEKELIIEVNSHNQDNFLNRSKLLKDFNSISNDRYDELLDKAKIWLSLVPDKFNSSEAVFSVTSQKNLLGLNSLAEQYALFILLIDSNLDMLRIYEEESMMPNVERRIIEEFGYFNQELLVLERKFHSRFCPEKKISIWTKIKKD